mmetsp:Transcript_1330/g.1638  ORF Transcript_1330/g.1638 Transcript_1330/m.1638 type:complete len:304 (+) Transcript_1330:560-1471(+)
MINTCDPALATWTDDGKMFVIKDQDTFAKDVIPRFFDHKKFTSFARQLNFYGFRKMQSKALYKNQGSNEANTHVTFINENFQRGKPELLKQISRSTSTKGVQPNNNQEMETLKGRVHQLESKIRVMKNDYEARFSQLEAHMYNLISYSNRQPPNAPSMPPLTNQMYPEAVALNQTQDVKINPSTSGDGTAVSASMEGQDSEPTLPAHPNSKVLPNGTAIPPPPLMRNISLLRGWSNGSFTNVDATPQLPPFEEKYFLNLMNNNSNNPHERLPNQAALTRQMSQGFQKLDINNIEEYPPLGEPM